MKILKSLPFDLYIPGIVHVRCYVNMQTSEYGLNRNLPPSARVYIIDVFIDILELSR